MEFPGPALLFSGLMISTVGLGMFMYGKRAERPGSIFAGLGLMIYPIFVTSVLWMWLIAVGCVGALLLSRQE